MGSACEFLGFLLLAAAVEWNTGASSHRQEFHYNLEENEEIPDYYTQNGTGSEEIRELLENLLGSPNREFDSESSNTQHQKNVSAMDFELIRTPSTTRYKFHATPLPWMDALHACWREGGRLAYPRSHEEAQALSALLTSTTDNSSNAYRRDTMHVGIHDFSQIEEKQWKTLDGLTLKGAGFDCWLGEPRSSRSYSCGALLRNGMYVSGRCGSSLPYACEMPGEAEGYTAIPDLGSYRVHTDPLPWTEALQRCKSEGATLVEITSGLEAGLVAGVFITFSDVDEVRRNGFFVGINDISEEGVWKTVSGAMLNESNNYDTWNSGSPTHNDSSNCGVLQATGKYSDAICSVPRAFLCKKSSFIYNTLSDSNIRININERDYYLHTEARSWMGAVLQCYKENTTLAMVQSRDEIQKLYRELREYYSNACFHVGVHDLDGDGIFHTLHGHQIDDDVRSGFYSSTIPFFSVDSGGSFNYPGTNECFYFCETALKDD